MILMKLRGPPITSGTIEDILSGEELALFMRIVFEQFKDIFYIENNLIDSAENVVYMMILLNIRSMCKNGLVDPASISSWIAMSNVLKNKDGFLNRYYSFLSDRKAFGITFDHKKYRCEYLVIYRKEREERKDLRSILCSPDKFSDFEQSTTFTSQEISDYRELTEKVFMSFKRPEQSIEDASLYSPVSSCEYLDKLERLHRREDDGQIDMPNEKQFRKEHAKALTEFVGQRARDAQPDQPPAQHEDGLEDGSDDPFIAVDDNASYAELGAATGRHYTGPTVEGEPATEGVDESWNEDEDEVEDEDLEIDSDVVTFENAAFVFLEALKRKLRKKKGHFKSLTLDLFYIFIQYGMGSLSQSASNFQAKAIAGKTPLTAPEVLRELTAARFMQTVREAARSLSPATDFLDDEEDDHEMNETIGAQEYDFEKTMGATHGNAATKMITEKTRFIETFSNNMIRVLIKLGLVQVFPVCTNLCTVDYDAAPFTNEDEPTRWTCPFCQTVNEKLQPGSFSSRRQQLVFMISPRLYIACLFEDPSISNVLLQNCSKHHCQSTDEETSHTFYNGEYVKRMKQFNKRTQLSNEREPQISNTKYFDESEIQLAVTLGWDGVAMFNKSAAQLKEPRELWPLVMRLVDFNSNTDFQLINFPSIHRKKAGVEHVRDERGKEDDDNVTPSMLNTEMTNTKVLLNCVTDEFVRIQRTGMLVKNHASNSGDSPVIKVFATVVNFFGDLPALTKVVGLRGTAGKAPCLSCIEVKQKVKDSQDQSRDDLPVTIEYNRWLSSEENGSSVSWAEKVGIEFEHLKGYVERFIEEDAIKRKATIPFCVTASQTVEGDKFRQRGLEFREVLKSLCQWVKIPAGYCNPDKHGSTNSCNDSTHMRHQKDKLEELLGVVSLDLGSCTPIYDFDLSMGQNKVIGFDVMHCLCENLFPKMLGLLSASKDTFLLNRKYALPPLILTNLMAALKSSLGASNIWPSEFGEPPTLVDTFEVYLKAEQAQQLISVVPALLSSDYYSRHLDPDFLKLFQLFTKMSKFLLGHNITKSEIPILESTIKDFCSLHRYLFYERHETQINAWLVQAQYPGRKVVPGVSTNQIPEVKLMVRMGSIYFHILIHVMTLVKEYGHSNLFSCYGLERSMGTIKSTNNSTYKIITSTGRNMISRSLSNCLSLAIAETNCLQASLLSRPSTDVKRNIAGRNILTLAKPIVQFDVTRETFGRQSFNMELMENSITAAGMNTLTFDELVRDYQTTLTSGCSDALYQRQQEDSANKFRQGYSNKMTESILDWITPLDIPNSLELANRVTHSTKTYERLLDGTERHIKLASTEEAGTLSLYVIRDYKMYTRRNPTTMQKIIQRWGTIIDDPKIINAIKTKLVYLVFKATNDLEMSFYHSQCCVTESSKCETNVFTLEMPFLIGPGANEEIIDTKKFVSAHINEDIIAYLRESFPRQFVKSCSSPSESIVPTTLSVSLR